MDNVQGSNGKFNASAAVAAHGRICVDKLEIIADEPAVPVNALPRLWQEIAEGSNEFAMSDRAAYVKMAQLFQYKLSQGDVDLFNRRTDLISCKEAWKTIFGTLARETLEFYAEDFRRANYPDFARIRERVAKGSQDVESKLKVVDIAEELFQEFRHDMPASFYYVHLAPINREEVCEIVPLRFSEEDKANARGWDAALHGQKVFPIQLIIQSISSRRGFFWEHGCGCNHGLSRVGKAETPFTYQLRPEMRKTWIRDYIWTCWYEYAYFPFTPVTKFLTGEIVEFS
jgi:hypothetical protein